MPVDTGLPSILEYELQRGSLELYGSTANAKFTWNGDEYPCTYVLIDQEYLVPGRLEEIGALTITASQRDFPDPGPKLHDPVILLGITYEIQIIKSSPGGSIVYTCWPPGSHG